MTTPTGREEKAATDALAMMSFLPRQLFDSALAHSDLLGPADGASLQRDRDEETRPRPQEETNRADGSIPPLEPAPHGSEGNRPVPGATAVAEGRPSVKLPHYNGERPLATYLVQVRLAAELNGWSAKRTGVQVALALEGEALQILEDLPPVEQVSWTAIEAALQRRFGQRIFISDAREQLASRRRHKDERLGKFAADLQLYARRGYPTYSQGLHEEMALEAFVRGIHPERLKEHLRLSAPSSLSAALAEAERVQNIFRTTESRHWVRQTSLEENGEELEVTRQTTAQPPQRRPREWKRPASGDGCHRCGEPGHIAWYCPAPAPLTLAPQLLEESGTAGGAMDCIRLGRLGQTRGLYVDCTLDGTRCRALIDTGSTISLVRPGLLPGTLVARPRGWEKTKRASQQLPESERNCMDKKWCACASTVRRRAAGFGWLAFRMIAFSAWFTLHLGTSSVVLHMAGKTEHEVRRAGATKNSPTRSTQVRRKRTRKEYSSSQTPPLPTQARETQARENNRSHPGPLA
ncbi:hypothetical protein AALO_G00113590, partial [Alosa alosa]